MAEQHWALKVIREFEEQRFFGSVVLRFRNGKVYLIEENRTILAPDEKNSQEDIHATRSIREV